MKVGPGAVAPGGAVTYTITVNPLNGATPTTVTINDALPTGLTFVSAKQLSGPDTFTSTPNGNTASFSAAKVTNTDMLQIIATAGASLIVGSTLPDNIATFTDAAGSGSSNPVSSVVAPAGAALSKSGTGAVTAGSLVTYTLTFTNTATSPVSNVTLTDVLPTGLTLMSTTQTGPDSFTNNNPSNSGNTVSFTGASVGAGNEDLIVITATAGSGLAVGTTITNVATFTTPSGGPSGSSNPFTTMVAMPGVNLAKTGPATVAPGGPVTYTLTFSNTGPAITGLVSITDTLPSGLTFVAAAQVSGPDTFAPPAPPTSTPTFTAASVGAGSLDVFQILATAGSTLPDGTPLTDNASFTGPNNLSGSASPFTTTVNAKATITLSSPGSVTFSTASQSFTVNATVASGTTAVNTGTVTFSVAGVSQTANISNGMAAAVLTLPGGQAAGSYTITASLSNPVFTATPATSPFVVAQSPTVVNVTNVTDKFGFLSQTETVTAQVTGSNGLAANSGSVTLTDGGQSKTVSVSNGQATATFTFSILQELQTAYPHNINASFTDNKGNFLVSSVSFLAPGDVMGFGFQLLIDDLLLLMLSGGNLGTPIGQSSGGGSH
jgi:uncharacterized repeat protein (TIGR01451 family)